jgi:hypothetical protein
MPATHQAPLHDHGECQGAVVTAAKAAAGSTCRLGADATVIIETCRPTSFT